MGEKSEDRVWASSRYSLLSVQGQRLPWGGGAVSSSGVPGGRDCRQWRAHSACLMRSGVATFSLSQVWAAVLYLEVLHEVV